MDSSMFGGFAFTIALNGKPYNKGPYQYLVVQQTGLVA